MSKTEVMSRAATTEATDRKAADATGQHLPRGAATDKETLRSAFPVKFNDCSTMAR